MAQANNLLLIMWLSELQLCSALCPNGFDEVDTNICLIGFQQNANFCQANERCETEGLKRGLRLFVPGLNAFKISPTILSKNKVFTSITALLNRSIVLKDGWQVGDPGFAGYIMTNGNPPLPWVSNDPNHPTQAISIISYGKFIDDPQQSLQATYVFCELSNKAVPGSVERFNRNWPFKLNSLFLSRFDTEACFASSTEASLTRCAMKCKMRLTCRSFYYNEQSLDCYMSLYVDSLLPLSLTSTPGSWTRFARPLW
ncbi:hypothetical protein D915_001484 [Fasciola hepatica]|uniref:Apple domain-containing protein n=1 Tax=Fasciola hepatica TaxID=6192 RepID=A0A4E0RG07_FASHE|nr:hypothetical protein D915_001484 [Fasciola hepatica]